MYHPVPLSSAGADATPSSSPFGPAFNITNGTTEEVQKAVYSQCPVSKVDSDLFTIAEESQPIRSATYLGGVDIQAFKLSDNRTGVISIPTFSPAAAEAITFGACDPRFVMDAYYGLKNLSEAGVDRVLVDTSSNNGGHIPLSQTLQRVFTSSELYLNVGMETVFTNGNWSTAAVEAYSSNSSLEWIGVFRPDAYRPPGQHDSLKESTNFMEPGQTFEINGHSLKLSNGISDYLYTERGEADGVDDYDKLPNFSSKAFFSPENIKFTGDGLCGSMCAAFTNFMIEYYNTTAIISTPQPDKPIEFASFGAAQVFSGPDIQQELEQIGLGHLFPPMTYAGALSVPIRANLSPRVAPGKFLQYRSYPAQDRFVHTKEQWEKPIEKWEAVARLWK